MIKVLAISASPRRGGNSETLLDGVIESVKSIRVSGDQSIRVKKIILSRLKIGPCTGCMSCHKTGECVIKDDMHGVYEDLLDCDCILIASPIYFKGIPCGLKCLIDRCNALWARKRLLGRSNALRPKAAGIILTCASSGIKDMFTGALITLGAFINTLDAEYKGELLAEGLEEKDAASKDKPLLEKAACLGRKVINP